MMVDKPVPPLVAERAWARVRLVMVVVERVEMPEIARVPVAVRLPPMKVLPATVSLEDGDVEPIPMLPAEVVVPVPLILLPKMRLPMFNWLEAVFEGASTS